MLFATLSAKYNTGMSNWLCNKLLRALVYLFSFSGKSKNKPHSEGFAVAMVTTYIC